MAIKVQYHARSDYIYEIDMESLIEHLRMDLGATIPSYLGFEKLSFELDNYEGESRLRIRWNEVKCPYVGPPEQFNPIMEKEIEDKDLLDEDDDDEIPI